MERNALLDVVRDRVARMSREELEMLSRMIDLIELYLSDRGDEPAPAPED